MHLKLLLPTEILIDQTVTKVTAEAENGSFCLLPNHIDFVAALVPGILSFESETGKEFFLAVDEGILVKQGAVVRVSVRNAVRGENLESLQQQVQQQFRQLDEQEKLARSVLVRLETSFVREFIELGG
ncbi:F0F1 ATP synthase subunit epsilon [Fischerella thermalis]|uniref:F0F1 ATP synthase subunit epsilon n=1 Tax=Fischerella thermalis CCMEE 5318 TaxID=2019666 RepID=A0A2N6LMJ5_9CYAN|nr:F0F1 ATP synthase subunit epsilon [Fischerella thermalis]PMB26527.1 F0F1 ATP synthase subunit epsilon [Fischerella thermalis CCMEE 5318]PMB39637.1 F0F1 ATP synthase subunit epsilon [Fischerella thermalis CCMEE 5319]